MVTPLASVLSVLAEVSVSVAEGSATVVSGTETSDATGVSVVSRVDLGVELGVELAVWAGVPDGVVPADGDAATTAAVPTAGVPRTPEAQPPVPSRRTATIAHTVVRLMAGPPQVR